MALQNSSNFANASAVYRTLFQEAFLGEEDSTWEAFTHQESITGTSFEYTFLTALPRAREWVGNKQFKSTRANKHRIDVKNYEASTSVSNIDYHQNPDGVGSQIRRWLSATRGFMNQLVIKKLLRGDVDLCFDGQPLFSTAHPNGPGGGTQSNTNTNALSQTNYRAAVVAMRALKDETGASIKVKPDLLLVGPAKEYIARDLSEARSRVVAVDDSGAESGTRVAAAAIENVSSNDGVRIIVDSEIASGSDGSGADTSNYWFLMDSRYPCMVVATARAPEPTDNTNEFQAEGADYKFSIWAQLAIGYGIWHGVFAGRSST